MDFLTEKVNSGYRKVVRSAKQAAAIAIVTIPTAVAVGACADGGITATNDRRPEVTSNFIATDNNLPTVGTPDGNKYVRVQKGLQTYSIGDSSPNIAGFVAAFGKEITVPLSASYMSTNRGIPASNSGLNNSDVGFGLQGRNFKTLAEVYGALSGIPGRDMYIEDALKKMDTRVDIDNLRREQASRKLSPRDYSGDDFLAQERTQIPAEAAYAIIGKVFGGFFDGKALDLVKTRQASFYLEASVFPKLSIDTFSLDSKRTDPTPPLYKAPATKN